MVPLTRSGRSMRSLDDTDPDPKQKIWNTKASSSQRSFSVLERQQILAEIAYICQPLLHLSTMGMFGFKSWIPWMVSFSCDVTRYVCTYLKCKIRFLTFYFQPSTSLVTCHESNSSGAKRNVQKAIRNADLPSQVPTL